MSENQRDLLVRGMNEITEAYQRDSGRSELETFKRMVRECRKYGFPLICILQGLSKEDQLKSAAKLLLQVIPTLSPADFPVSFPAPVPESQLYSDSLWLLEHTVDTSYDM
ncbi:hypothetical protein [Pseudomonas asiatica]|uniref:hypothetical protein n=1 Tax=Pseudomonas asiatica TaxID=2219225 RepID=UPI0010C05585|nr:hypothetical protein [Pseudomonas asiatica]